jgi:hypothetical protein
MIMIDAKIAQAKALIIERERIDRELLELFGEAALPKRGRPRKDRGHEALPDNPPSQSTTGE